MYEEMETPARPSAAPSDGTIWLHGRIERDEVASVSGFDNFDTRG